MESSKFHGVFPALVTPFTREGKVSLEELREVARFHVEKGVNGFFVCGTVGEGPMMSIRQRKLVAETVIEEVSDRVSIIVHAGTTNTEETVELARHAEKSGADAVGVVSPYFFKPDLEGIIDHYRIVSESVDIPVIVYNIPSLTGFNLTSQIVMKLCELPNIIGVKDSSRDLIQIREIIETAPKKITVINGADNLTFAALMIGVDGQISGMANVAPELFVGLYRAFKAGDHARALKIQKDINSVIRALSGLPPIAPIKAALELRGIKAGLPKRPLRPLKPEEISKLKEKLTALNLFW
jgi:4-hydroxy-tetrahydrodipicolinate synthase